MGRIRVLPSAVADQIAAGEVVERPASVIKELVENALDAGASSIHVEIEDGGRAMVRVADDGVGMERDDAELALNRHATSKIAVTADLVGVATYGFRGEALPAIASVSLFELETATAPGVPSGEGTRVVARGGKLESVEAVGRGPGTTVTVKRLFYNTPARRKFLRSQRAESRAAVQALAGLALARLDVSFKLTSDARILLDAPRVSSVADRIASLFGRKVAEGLLPVELNTGPISVRGLVQRPAEARATGRKAFLFINGRPFKDPFLVRAAENGYRATIPANVRPTMFLSLGLSGDRVDVNVHPAKLEVRFRDRMLVERAVEEAVRHALRPMEAAAEVEVPGATLPSERRFGYLQAATADQGFPRRQTSTMLPGLELPITSESRIEGHEFLQAFNTYIVFESADGITIVDQHSAHERVLYERTMAEMNGEGSASQRLLLPLTIDLEAEELEVVDTQKELLSIVGFEVDHFGGNSVVVHAVPNPHPRFDARRCFEDLIADLARGRLPSLNRLERFAATYACRAAVMAGQELEQAEMRTLMNHLFACDLPPHDIHGRPTIVRLPRDELERKFGRS